MTPACYNRPPYAEGRWLDTGRMRVNLLTPWPAPACKPVWRWVPRFFEDRCAAHDGRGIGPNGENYPDAHGWVCDGCRWEPAERRQRREFEARMQAPSYGLLGEFGKLMTGMKPIRTDPSAAFTRIVLGESGLEAHPVKWDEAYAEPVDNPVDNPGVIPNVRDEMTQRAAEYVRRTGRPVSLTCAGHVVGRIGPAVRPGSIHPDDE